MHNRGLFAVTQSHSIEQVTIRARAGQMFSRSELLLIAAHCDEEAMKNQQRQTTTAFILHVLIIAENYCSWDCCAA